ncbi:MAG: phosphatidate cytidylyltransferase [Myxococcota bacterium]|nr:phosphatidate cytidylyltransferase [Myxococcota bacterium]
MLKTRVIVAVIFAPLLALLVWLGGYWLGGLCVAIAMVGLWEYLQLTLGSKEAYAKAFAYALGIAVCIGTLGWRYSVPLGTLWPLSTIVLLLSALLRPEPIDASIRRTAFMVLGVGYCCGLIPYLSLLRDTTGGLGFAFGALFCTWASDTGAYFAGRALGKHKLYPKISPSKTIEGLVGGLLLSVLVAVLVRHFFALPISMVDAVVIGCIAALLGTAGDLCESMLKRSVGAKDSSTLIPGHGGVLDRFDAVMFVAPAIYLYLAVFVF